MAKKSNEYEGKKEEAGKWQVPHASQLNVLNDLWEWAKIDKVPPAEAKSYFIRKKQNELLERFRYSDTYQVAKAKGLSYMLLKCVEPQLEIIAYALFDEQFPAYDYDGNLKGSRAFPLSTNIAPDINATTSEGRYKLKELAQSIYDTKELALDDDRKKAIVKAWGWLKDGNEIGVNLKSFM
jgi:hypothetical protein